MMLEGELEYSLKDVKIYVHTNKGKISIEFNPDLFRPAEVPILLSDTGKIQKKGAVIQHTLNDIIKDQLNYFIKKENRI
jgi:GDPmannose 4,6-dehydratase